MPRIGVILSGCGVFDGSEIHEAVLTLLCLDQQGAAYQCLAPDRSFTVVNHATQKPTGETRNCLVEAARIARGDILPLVKVRGGDYDGFVLPGGFGAAKSLCSFAMDGPQCQVDPEVQRVLKEAHAAGKPIGFVCIAPAVAAAVFGKTLHPTLTIGHDAGTAAGLEAMGARHQPCAVEAIVLDADHRLLSTPAYMEARTIQQVYAGISQLVVKLVELARPAPVAAK